MSHLLSHLSGRGRARSRGDKKHLVLLGAVVLLAARPGAAATLSVCAAGCDYSTISAAYAAAACGDTVEILDNGPFDDVVVMSHSCRAGAELTVRSGAGVRAVIAPSEAGWIDGAIVLTGDYHVIDGITVRDIHEGDGIRLAGSHNVLRNLVVENVCTSEIASGQCGEGVSFSGGSYNVLEDSVIGDCGHGAVTLGGAIMSSVQQRNQVLRNTITNRYGHGVSLVCPGTQYNLVEGNFISQSGALSNQNDKNGMQISGASHNSVRRNVFFDLRNRGMEVSGYSDVTSKTEGNWIYNNTFFNITTRTDNTGATAWIVADTGGAGPYTLKDNKFFNNLADRVGQVPCDGWNGVPYAAFLLGYVVPKDAGNTESALISNDWNGNILKNNDIRVYHDGTYDLGYDAAVYYATTRNDFWVTYSVTGVNGRGSMSGNRTDDPELVSTDTSQPHWWHLQATSPLVNAGIVVDDPNAAAGGWAQLTYDGTAPDIGANEHPERMQLDGGGNDSGGNDGGLDTTILDAGGDGGVDGGPGDAAPRGDAPPPFGDAGARDGDGGITGSFGCAATRAAPGSTFAQGVAVALLIMLLVPNSGRRVVHRSAAARRRRAG